MTTFKQFMDEIEQEAREEGQQAIDELEAFQQYYRRQFPVIEQPEQPCLMEAFFRHQETLPPSMRTNVAHLYCPCPRCNPARL